MAAAADAAERYRADFQAAGAEIPAWLAGLRKRAMERFAETGFPTARRGNEAWKYTNVSPIANAELGLAPATDITLSKALRGAPPLRAAPDGPWTTLVFANGRFAGGSGNKVAMPLAAALDRDDSWVEAHLARTGSIDSGGFAALNAAFLTDAAVVRVPADGPLAAVHLVFIATGESSISHPRALIVVEPNARAAIVETHLHTASNRQVANAVTEIEAGDNADLVHAKLVLGARGSSHVGSTTARLGRGARLTSTVYTGGAELVRNGLDVRLEGDGAACRLDGLSLTHGSQHVDNQTSIEHLAPRTTSAQRYRAVLDGQSRSVFSGRVHVAPNAVKADADQSSRGLLLSKKAEADSKPSLEIWTDDVKCRHGATVGRLDEAALFYLRSRGLEEPTARRMLVEAFAAEIVAAAEPRELRAYLSRRLRRELGRGSKPAKGTAS